MYTFQDGYTEAQEMTGDYSASRLIKFKRDINQGATIFLNSLGRKFNKEYISTNIVANQQYYQLPNAMLRVSEIRVLQGTNNYKPILVASEEEWDEMNTITVTGSFPTHYFIRGSREIGLYPVPSSNVTSGLKVSGEPQHGLMTQADYTTGTITTANGSTTITHSGTGFTPQMVGRGVEVTDGTDSRWYRIASYSSTSVLLLDNYYEGISGSGRTFRIGEVTKIPDGYQDAPTSHALKKYYLTQDDKVSARDHAAYFKDSLKMAKVAYGRSTTRLGSKASVMNSRKPRWIDLTSSVIYP